jgi:hypothetical protein
MRISYSRNPLLLLACFTEQSGHDHFDMIAVQVTHTFTYSVTVTVMGRTTAIVSIAASVLPAGAANPKTKASQHEKESATK